MSYWNKVRCKDIERCNHKAEDGSLICDACWDKFAQTLSDNT